MAVLSPRAPAAARAVPRRLGGGAARRRAGLAAVLRRPRTWLVAVGIAGNVAIVGMYVVSRTYGPPFGPHARVPEVAGEVDLATTAAEVALVGVLLTMLGPRARRWVANLLVALGASLWLLRLSGAMP